MVEINIFKDEFIKYILAVLLQYEKKGVAVVNRYIVAFSYLVFLVGYGKVYFYIYNHKWANRGFLYGYICPIYGCGSILGLFIYDLMKTGHLPNMEWWDIFILGFIINMIIEYPTSWALEKWFQARWWDYSDFP